MAVDVSKENYDQEMLGSSIPVLADFWGPRCTKCFALMPTLDQLEEKYKGKLKVVKLDASQNRRLCMNLKVMSLPTFLLFRNGEEVGRIRGEITAEQLTEKIDAFMNQNV